jgi:hypothetical protein
MPVKVHVVQANEWEIRVVVDPYIPVRSDVQRIAVVNVGQLVSSGKLKESKDRRALAVETNEPFG